MHKLCNGNMYHHVDSRSTHRYAVHLDCPGEEADVLHNRQSARTSCCLVSDAAVVPLTLPICCRDAQLSIGQLPVGGRML